MILNPLEFSKNNYKYYVFNVILTFYYIKIFAIQDAVKIVWIVELLNKIKNLKYLQNVLNVEQINMDQ